MKNPTTLIAGPRRLRSRFGYGPSFWGAQKPLAPASVPMRYWALTRTPLCCLVFVVPMLLAYEIGVTVVGGPSADAVRTGADSWMRHALANLGLTDRWLPPLVLVASLLAWQAHSGAPWRIRLRDQAGMAAESLLLALVLIGASRVVDLGFDQLEGRPILQYGSRTAATIVGFLGAGVYEEALFRLALIPLIYGLARLIHVPELLAGTMAVTGSALLFSLAHHAGLPGEAFTWFAFIFRWLAGVFFAWVFLIRGFGIAVGTHAAYDVLVGWVGIHF